MWGGEGERGRFSRVAALWIWDQGKEWDFGVCIANGFLVFVAFSVSLLYRTTDTGLWLIGMGFLIVLSGYSRAALS